MTGGHTGGIVKADFLMQEMAGEEK